MPRFDVEVELIDAFCFNVDARSEHDVAEFVGGIDDLDEFAKPVDDLRRVITPTPGFSRGYTLKYELLYDAEGRVAGYRELDV